MDMKESLPGHSTHGMERQDTVRYTVAHERAKNLKESKLKGRNLRDFVGGMISKESVQKAEAYVNHFDGLFNDALSTLPPEQVEYTERSKTIAECLEGVILGNRNWFGLTANVFPTTRYDDYKHGVDMVVERSQDGFAQHEGVAMDVTYAGRNGIQKKVDRIVDNLKRGKLGTVSFFKSADGSFKGELNNLPLVVIGADFNTMSDMINLFAEDSTKSNQQLAEHPFQFQMIEQVMLQCDTYIDLVEGFDMPAKDRETIVSAYTKLRATYKNLYRLKSEKTLSHVDHDMRDKFHINLQTYLETLRPTVDQD